MSNRSYPHYVGKVKGNPRWPPTVKCEVCDSPATCYAEVQWSWFRGDDESYKVCDEHLKFAREDVSKFCGATEASRLQKRNKAEAPVGR